MSKKAQLEQKNAQLAGNMSAIAAAAEAENRNMKPEEAAQFEAHDAELQQNQAEIARLDRLEAVASQAQARVTTVTEVPTAAQAASTTYRATAYTGTPTVTGGTPVAHNFANHGFTKGMGEFLLKTREAATSGRVDPRLMVNAVTTWAGETVGADGGFALPPQFVQGIMSLVMPPDSFLQALNPIPTSSDLITIPTDEDAPWAATGVSAGKVGEGSAIPASKVAVKQVKVVMYGVKSLVHVDEKSLRDMAFLSAFVTRKMGEKIRWKVENYVMNGTGDNEPLGILNAPGLYAITDTNSTATVIGAEDVALCEASCFNSGNKFWITHPLVKAQIRTLKSGSGGYPLYTTDFSQGPKSGLLGYPLYTSEAAKPLNTTGDFICMCADGYVLAFEAGGPQSDTTIAFAFDQNLQSFRSTLYMGGAPTLSAKVLRADGVNYASNICALAGGRS
jgi:HK97 family phage major capsid protein